MSGFHTNTDVAVVVVAVVVVQFLLISKREEADRREGEKNEEAAYNELESRLLFFSFVKTSPH